MQKYNKKVKDKNISQLFLLEEYRQHFMIDYL